jgi:O-methyltransferase
MIEAGCWQGGSTAKWSLACRLLGYGLHIYDSFEGVEARTDVEGQHDFTGEYAAPLETVRQNLVRHGNLSPCTFHKGWFVDTMQPGSVPGPVRLVYIDCDLVKGTKEVLAGVVPVLSDDGVVASQDGQIRAVAEFLARPATWESLGVRVSGTRLSRHLLVFQVSSEIT